MFFRGHNTTKYSLDYVISKAPLELTEKFVLIGNKVGALASIAWTDYV